MKNILILFLLVLLTGPVMAQDFVIGDSTVGTSTQQPMVVGTAFGPRISADGTDFHLYTVVEGDSITTLTGLYQYGSGDSIEVGLYLATTDTLPDTLINSWKLIQTDNSTEAYTTWNIDYPIPSDNWGDVVIMAMTMHYGTGFSVWDADSAIGGSIMTSRDAVSDSLLPQTWVQSSSLEGSPTIWFEGLNVSASASSAVGSVTLGKATVGK